MSSRIALRGSARLARIAASPAGRQFNSSRLPALPRAQPILRSSDCYSRLPSQTRSFATANESGKSTADEKIEEIQELYATARDEFEIAAEETEGNTVYAADDRAAAREELDKLKGFYNAVVEGPDKATAEEVKKRVGQRIRELDNAVIAMEEHAAQGD